ncbi:hypothetical protein [Actinophytocola sp. NPDC049390]|uniref:hypothetical protein n=1 Tax=Actinophytocola sp. NPDC049390 TaxID=3363894 RepID=UPI003787BDD1
MTDFRPGDRVRVSYEAEYLRAHRTQDGCHEVRVPDDTNTRVTLRSATVELIERADDPSKDPVGTIRRHPKCGPYIRMDYTTANPWLGFNGLCSWNDHEGMVGSEVVGAVPDTPAAEKQAEQERPLWTGDGSEEPPEYVTKVRWSRYDPEANGTPFAGRAEDGRWFWMYEADESPTRGSYTFAQLAEIFGGAYTEVRA